MRPRRRGPREGLGVIGAISAAFLNERGAAVTLATRLPYSLAYAGLFASLALSYSLNPEVVLGRGISFSIAYSFAALLPVYFAGLVFARSFEWAPLAGPAIGANMLGAVLGGWVEYSSMALGIRALVAMAMGFYVGSLLCLRWASTQTLTDRY